ncbi:YqiA/YcfP family alpha/beta fold hydrolase [Amantichitinum ursilacus]|uniref:Esterase YqiA n=1 Tax=Amantichitinum ursilacus TaxID=857265 RepID=A0A0N0XI90_9NEIS|nr:YqiA/YcfP family alpha/beta fold hydrolase [Amantichitinum ursilacus]KPC52078.1 esterase YqiA [Amantichitinum ursilacus]
MVHLMYLHGFLSSPFSQKAQDTAVWMAEQSLADYFHCPQIPMEPVAAGRVIQASIDKLGGEPVCFIGSSLGGYFANWAVEEGGGRAVLINPAVRPYELLRHYIGPQRNYQTGEIHHIDVGYGDQLRKYERPVSKPDQYWLMVQTGDTTLDYREAVERYPLSRQTVIEGGDHSFQNYVDWLPRIWEFAQEGK